MLPDHCITLIPELGKMNPCGVCLRTPDTAAVGGAEECSIPAPWQGEPMHMIPISSAEQFLCHPKPAGL